MDLIFDNLQWIGIIVFAFIAWLNKRSEMKAEKEDAERARREMIEGMAEMARHRQRAQPADPRPQRATPPPVKTTPPPLKPTRPPEPEPATVKVDPYMIDDRQPNRNDRIQQRLAEARKEQEQSLELAKQAREKRLRAEPHHPHQPAPARAGTPATLKSILADPRQSRRAIVLREILGPPVALRR